MNYFINDANCDPNYTYLFTREEHYLNEYFRIRKQVYIDSFHIKDFSTHIDRYDNDKNTYILIVFFKGSVIGGSRLTFHYKDSQSKLPMEWRGFELNSIFPELNLERSVYIETTRMAVLPEYRSGREIGSRMIAYQLIMAMEQKAEYVFAITPLLQGRNNRMHFNSLGLKMEILNNINIPDRPAYEGKKMYLSMSKINIEKPKGYSNVRIINYYTNSSSSLL